MIKKVVLKNWKSHLNSSLEFGLGTNALIGIIGSGKSSVLDAICFALYGTFPALSSKKIKLEDIIMRKPMLKDYAEVELHFSFRNNEYIVRRRIERGKGTTKAELVENGKIIEAQPSRVSELIEKILKTSYELFSKVIYSEQNSLDYFLRLPKGQRIKKVDELLMIERLEKIRSNLVTLANRIRDQRNSIAKAYESYNVEELEKEISELESRLDEINKHIHEITQQLNALETELTQISSNYEYLRNRKKELDDIVIELEKTRALLEEKTKRLSQLKMEVEGRSKEILENKKQELLTKLETLKNELEKEKNELAKLREEIIHHTSTKKSLENEIADLKLKISEKEESKKQLDSLLKTYPNIDEILKNKKIEVESKLAKIKFLEMKASEIKESLEKLREAKEKCPICNSPLTPEHIFEISQKKNKELKETESELATLIRNLELEKKELETLEKIDEKIRLLNQEISDLDELKKKSDTLTFELRKRESMLNSLSKALQEKEALIEKKEVHLRELEKEIDAYDSLIEKIEEYVKLEDEVNGIKAKLASLLRQHEEISREVDEAKLTQIEKTIQKIIAKKASLEKELESLEREKREKNVSVEKLNSQLENIKKLKEEIEKLDKIYSNLKIMEKALKLTQTQLRQEFVTSINLEMNRVWETLYPYGDYVAIRLNVEEGDYVLQLQDKAGRWVSVDGFVSGGERSLAVLALRIALALVLAPQLKLLVLDEPTHNLDKKAVEELARALRERVSEFLEQVLIITHDEKMEDAITGHAYLLSRNKAVDEPTKIVKL